MRFWDSSALVPLLVAEPMTPAVASLYQDGVGALVWWATEVECGSAVSRLERMGKLDSFGSHSSFSRLERLAKNWHVVDPVESVKVSALRFVRVHQLKAADAQQLGAALQVSEGRPPSLEFVCFDTRLVEAARKEGFRVIDRSVLQLDRAQ